MCRSCPWSIRQPPKNVPSAETQTRCGYCMPLTRGKSSKELVMVLNLRDRAELFHDAHVIAPPFPETPTPYVVFTSGLGGTNVAGAGPIRQYQGSWPPVTAVPTTVEPSDEIVQASGCVVPDGIGMY